MTTSAGRSNPLTVMLIISAIDVLLCAFTATITLFFLGGGQAAVTAGDEVGWAGVLVITYSDQGVELVTDFPNEVVSASSVFRLESLPTEPRPARFKFKSAPPAGPIVIDVTAVRGGRPAARRRITCDSAPADGVFRVDDTEVAVRPEPDCQ